MKKLKQQPYIPLLAALLLVIALLILPGFSEAGMEGQPPTFVPSYAGALPNPQEGEAAQQPEQGEPSADAALPTEQGELPVEEAQQPEGNVTWEEGQPLVLTVTAQEGFRMPYGFLLRINETEYPVRTDGLETPEGVSYDPNTGKLRIDPMLVSNGDNVTVLGAAIGVTVTAELADFSLKENIWLPFSAAEPLALTLVPDVGFVLPETVELVLNDILYKLPTDGSNPHEGVAFDPASGMVIIAPGHLGVGKTVTLKAAARCVDPEILAQREAENQPKDIYIAVEVDKLPTIAFTEAASHTLLSWTDPNIVQLTPGQDLVLQLETAPETVLPESIHITIKRENGMLLEEIFRFDGKENAEFLRFEPETLTLRVLSYKLLDLDQIILAPTPAEETEEETDAAIDPTLPESVPTVGTPAVTTPTATSTPTVTPDPTVIPDPTVTPTPTENPESQGSSEALDNGEAQGTAQDSTTETSSPSQEGQPIVPDDSGEGEMGALS